MIQNTEMSKKLFLLFVQYTWFLHANFVKIRELKQGDAKKLTESRQISCQILILASVWWSIFLYSLWVFLYNMWKPISRTLGNLLWFWIQLSGFKGTVAWDFWTLVFCIDQQYLSHIETSYNIFDKFSCSQRHSQKYIWLASNNSRKSKNMNAFLQSVQISYLKRHGDISFH